MVEKTFAMSGARAERSPMSSDASCKKTSSPANPPESAGGVSSARKNEPLFKTITSDDWRRSLASARRQPNAVSEQIRTVISSSSRKTK